MVMFSKKNLRKRRRGLADFIPGFHGNILSNPHDNHEPHHCLLSASVSSSTAAMASVSPSALVAAEIVAWRGPAEYPRRPRRVAQSGVSRPGLDPPRREVTPGTMEAAINLKIAVDIVGADAGPRCAPVVTLMLGTDPVVTPRGAPLQSTRGVLAAWRGPASREKPTETPGAGSGSSRSSSADGSSRIRRSGRTPCWRRKTARNALPSAAATATASSLKRSIAATSRSGPRQAACPRPSPSRRRRTGSPTAAVPTG